MRDYSFEKKINAFAKDVLCALYQVLLNCVGGSWEEVKNIKDL